MKIRPYNANEIPGLIGKEIIFGQVRKFGRISNVIFERENITIVVSVDEKKIKMSPEILAYCANFLNGTPCGVSWRAEE